MSLVREFASIGAFSRFLNERVAAIEAGGAAISLEVAKYLHKKVTKEYGDKVLPELAQATQDERAALGYSTDEPLKRTGQMLRDSWEWAVGIDFAAIGSAEPVVAYQEFGYWNVRANKKVVARHAVKTGIEEAAPGVMALMERNLGRELGFREYGLSSNLESKTTVFTLDAAETE